MEWKLVKINTVKTQQKLNINIYIYTNLYIRHLKRDK